MMNQGTFIIIIIIKGDEWGSFEKKKKIFGK